MDRILGQPDRIHRLEEFGLRRGIKVEMFRPGNPCIIRLAGNKVCIRLDGLLDILVQPIGAWPTGRNGNRRRIGWHR